MKKFLHYFKNKYILTGTIFVLYGLFLDDVDVFTIFRQKAKLTQLNEQKEIVKSQLNDTRYTLDQLKFDSEIERYAREKKLFKKDNEDVFVISYE